MVTKRAELLVHQLDIAWALFEYHLDGLDDEAALWEPATHSWNVRLGADGRWMADWADSEPDPVPAMSAGWVMWHMGYWWTTTLGHCFGDGAPEREEIVWPGGAAAAAEWLRGLKDAWREGLLGLTDAELDSGDKVAKLPWGQGQTMAGVAGWLIVELTKNVAEVGYVRILRAAS
ncbi:DinB family protein [Nonomuraea sp. NPDC059023]|uniref:DinB family protein n=1 Tax=unclassified Nonomuraea TaxID=2593643 RepID=UPI0036CCBED4